MKGVDAKVEYDCDPTEDQPTVFMSTHASSLDICSMYTQSITRVNWVFKKSLSLIPWYGVIAMTGGNIPIDRGNLKNAIESLKKAEKQIEVEKKKISISPEGTRRRKKSIGSVEQLLPFKKGPFHLAKNSKSSIIPVVWIGCNRLTKGLGFTQGKAFLFNLLREDYWKVFKENSCQCSPRKEHRGVNGISKRKDG